MFEWRYTANGVDIGSVYDLIWHGPDHQPLDLSGPNNVSGIDQNASGLARYVELLPVNRSSFKTLGAGMTPLVRGLLADHEVYFKLDSLLPSGSFKDRGAAVSVATLHASNVRRIVVDSSGNAAAAMSAYCAAYGIACEVYAPANVSHGKLVQSDAYGATVNLVQGSRDDVAAAAQAAAHYGDDTLYVSHNWSPVFAEGVKTWALEVWEQLGQTSPASVFVPTGGGSALAGAFRGFEATGSVPLITAVQPAACAPISAAFHADSDNVDPVEPGTTIAEGAKIAAPPRGNMLLQLLQKHACQTRHVDEALLRSALKALWSQGIYAEPTAALGAAGFIQAIDAGAKVSGPVVILITGFGLKATDTIQKVLDE